MRKRAEKLGVDVVTNVLNTVTNANYGAAAVTSAAAAFDSDDVTDISAICGAANWGNMRSLILAVSHYTALLKDPSVKSVMNYGTADAIRERRIPRLSGFDVYEANFIPTNGEQLVGMAVHPAALLFVNAPIEPTPEVRDNLSAYEAVVDPATGVTFEYRRWGNPSTDSTDQVIECNFGSGLGNAAALRRIVSA